MGPSLYPSLLTLQMQGTTIPSGSNRRRLAGAQWNFNRQLFCAYNDGTLCQIVAMNHSFCAVDDLDLFLKFSFHIISYDFFLCPRVCECFFVLKDVLIHLLIQVEDTYWHQIYFYYIYLNSNLHAPHLLTSNLLKIRPAYITSCFRSTYIAPSYFLHQLYFFTPTHITSTLKQIYWPLYKT